MFTYYVYASDIYRCLFDVIFMFTLIYVSQLFVVVICNKNWGSFEVSLETQYFCLIRLMQHLDGCGRKWSQTFKVQLQEIQNYLFWTAGLITSTIAKSMEIWFQCWIFFNISVSENKFHTNKYEYECAIYKYDKQFSNCTQSKNIDYKLLRWKVKNFLRKLRQQFNYAWWLRDLCCESTLKSILF